MARKRSYLIGILLTVMLLSVGCGSAKKGSTEKNGSGNGASKKEHVRMTVWSGNDDKELMQKVIDGFVEENKNQADITILWKAVEEGQCRSTLLGNVQKGADVYVTTDGDLRMIAAGGAAQPVSDSDVKQMKENNLKASVDAMTVNKKIYGYPLTADNGYFLYYNKKYFKDSDMDNFNKIIAVAAKKHKKVAMDFSSGWYLYSFFGETGLRVGLNKDGVTNYCDWNKDSGSVTGVDVVNALKKIASSSGFANMNQAQWDQGIAKGDVIACVSGVWNETSIKAAWGDDMGACSLPTYDVAGKQIQMSGYFGYKLVGVNPYSENLEWAQKFAGYLSNEKNQILRFEMRGQAPANTKAAGSEEVQNSVAVKAVLEQSKHSTLQRIGTNYWNPMTKLGTAIASGSSKSSQKLIDEAVKGITKPTV